MPGVRLAHPTSRSTVLVLEDPSRPYVLPYLCPSCEAAHLVKTYHLKLDSAGTCIVSAEVADRVLSIPGSELEFRNTVASPPAQTVVIEVPAHR